jgi:hypothetical protein
MSANICRETATSASWKVTYRPWLTTFAPILISLSRRLVSGFSRRPREETGDASSAERCRGSLALFSMK